MANKFVSTTGSDTNSGTIISPYATVDKGLQNVGLGETVYMRGGTYGAKVSNPTGITYGTQESERITVRPYESEPVTFQPGSGTHIFQLRGDIAYLTLSGLVFNGTNLNAGAGQMVKIWTQGSVDITNFILDGCTLLNAPDHAFQIDPQSDSCTWKNNIVINPGSNPGAEVNSNGFYLRGSNHVVEDNVVGYTFTPPTGTGCIRLGTNQSDVGNDCTNGIIRRNYVYGGGIGIILGTGNDMLAYNNLVRACLVLGIQIWGQSGRPTDNCKVYHNTVVHPTGIAHGVRIILGGTVLGVPAIVTNSLVRNNLLHRCTTPIDVSADTGTAVTTDNYTGTSPGFANDGGTTIADYILTGSPATIDGGADLRSDVPTDFYGNTRDATPDQGFYESVAPSSPTIGVSSSYAVTKNIAYTLSDGVVYDEDGDVTYLDGVFSNLTTTVMVSGSPSGTLTTRS